MNFPISHAEGNAKLSHSGAGTKEQVKYAAKERYDLYLAGIKIDLCFFLTI